MISLLIAGSRTVTPRHETISRWVRDLSIDTHGKALEPRDFLREVVCGAADGADDAGARWAIAVGVPVRYEPITAEDMKLGKFLGPRMRNRRMAIRADVGVVYWDGISGGSSDMVARMVARNKRCDVIPHLTRTQEKKRRSSTGQT